MTAFGRSERTADCKRHRHGHHVLQEQMLSKNWNDTLVRLWEKLGTTLQDINNICVYRKDHKWDISCDLFWNSCMSRRNNLDIINVSNSATDGKVCNKMSEISILNIFHHRLPSMYLTSDAVHIHFRTQSSNLNKKFRLKWEFYKNVLYK